MPSIQWELSLVNTQIMDNDDLSNLSNGANAISGPIDNETDTYLFDLVQLDVDFLYPPSVGGHMDLYMISSIDGGVTYADGNDSIDPALSALAGVFEMRPVDGMQVCILDRISIPPGYFKYLIINNTGTDIVASPWASLRRLPYRYKIE